MSTLDALYTELVNAFQAVLAATVRTEEFVTEATAVDEPVDVLDILLADEDPAEVAAHRALDRALDDYRQVYARWDDAVESYRRCPRCSGRGIVEAYRHVLDGECFRCGGSGVDPTTKEIEAPTPHPADAYGEALALLR